MKSSMFCKKLKCASLIACCVLLLASCGQPRFEGDADERARQDGYDEGYEQGYADGCQYEENHFDEESYPLSSLVADLMSEKQFSKVDIIINTLKDEVYMSYIYDCDYILDTRTNVYHDVNCTDVENISSRYVQTVLNAEGGNSDLLTDAQKHDCQIED